MRLLWTVEREHDLLLPMLIGPLCCDNVHFSFCFKNGSAGARHTRQRGAACSTAMASARRCPICSVLGERVEGPPVDTSGTGGGNVFRVGVVSSQILRVE